MTRQLIPLIISSERLNALFALVELGVISRTFWKTVLAFLKSSGLEDNTILVFLTDNGASGVDADRRAVL